MKRPYSEVSEVIRHGIYVLGASAKRERERERERGVFILSHYALGQRDLKSRFQFGERDPDVIIINHAAGRADSFLVAKPATKLKIG